MIIFSLIWVDKTFSVQSLNQIIYHTKFTSSDFDIGIFYDYLIKVIPLSMISFLIVLGIIAFVKKKKYKNIEHYYPYICIMTIVASLTIACLRLNVIAYFTHKSESTDFYQTHYVNPEMTNITFGENKHNLIHIYLESIESTYVSKDNGGYFDESLMPELEQLALENIHFSHQEKIGGALTLEGTQWTTASVIAQTSGITSSLSIDNEKYEPGSSFLPGVYSLGEVLQKEGYHQEVIMGSNADFAGISNYYQQHGDYEILDYYKALEDGRIPKDYHVFWGFEDQKLFEIAKEEITRLANEDGYFSVEMMTIDPHTPNGYVCEQCPKIYDNQYKNVIACQSHQVYEFVQWLQQQDFYENTTIVITGDHKSMSSQFFSDFDTSYVRTPYNCIINSVVSTDHTKNRSFNVVDMYPTILASIGAQIEGDRLGIGTNLFSHQQTLLEKYGLDFINNELSKTDSYYQRKLLGLKKEQLSR